jgi:hypothetical protein
VGIPCRSSQKKNEDSTSVVSSAPPQTDDKYTCGPKRLEADGHPPSTDTGWPRPQTRPFLCKKIPEARFSSLFVSGTFLNDFCGLRLGDDNDRVVMGKKTREYLGIMIGFGDSS